MTTNIDFKDVARGQYEAERLPKDFSSTRIVPDFAFNILNPLGLLYKPVVDEAYLSEGGAKPVWPEGKPFAVCLTHDVDLVSQYSFQQSARMFVQQFKRSDSMESKTKGFLVSGLGVLRKIKHAAAQDPLHCFERWLEAEKKAGAHSTFFFWPGRKAVNKYHSSDCLYDLEDKVVFDRQRCSVTEMIREIDRCGWEIGLHPSWYSFDNIDEIKRQKEALERSLGHEIISLRQHYLHYDIRVTPRVHAEAGFKFDSTLGFNDNIGFRFGTCYPWHLYDLESENELKITEIPLIIQDAAMLNLIKGMRLDEDTAFQYVEQLAEAVEKVGGVLTLLWHPNSIIDPSWWNLYLRTLEYLQIKDPFFATVREVGEWWEKVKNKAGQK